jgi:hypothetical protein
LIYTHTEKKEKELFKIVYFLFLATVFDIHSRPSYRKKKKKNIIGRKKKRLILTLTPSFVNAEQP